MNRTRPKPTRQMLRDVQKLAAASKFIDPKQSYRMDSGTGTTYETTGAELIRTGEVLAAFMRAVQSGDQARIEQAMRALDADMQGSDQPCPPT